MRRLIDRCAGIDVGQALLVVCVRVVSERGRVAEEVRSFGATTPDLVELRDWLASLGVTHVAMESTGVYWQQYHLVKQLPGCGWPASGRTVVGDGPPSLWDSCGGFLVCGL
jgi:hypothetical protein